MDNAKGSNPKSQIMKTNPKLWKQYGRLYYKICKKIKLLP